MEIYYKKLVSSVLKELKTNKKKGLTQKEAISRNEEYGLNILKNEKKVSALKVFLNQFKSLLILILFIAAIISFFAGEFMDSIVIILIVVLNSILGFVQEYRAEKSIESLKKMTELKCRVIRDGKEILLDSKHVTVGDILVFEAGDKIPADARVIDSVSLQLAEAVLTGESLPVSKFIEKIDHDSVIGDQKNMVFAGTVVTRGRGRAVVTNIGMNTEIGKIAGMMQEAPEKQTNLQKDLNKLSKWLGTVVLVICIVIFFSDVIIVGDPIQEAFLVAIALSVAAIPEGLPAVVTISLGLGVKRLVKKNALMRKLSSVEALGSVNIICTDKTGTLTKNEMTVKKIFVDNKIFDLDGVGYEDFGKKDILSKNKLNKDSLQQILRIGLLCNNSEINGDGVVGDPTEISLLVSGIKGGLDRKKEEKEFKFLDEISFDSERKIMTTIRRSKDGLYFFSKGASEILIEKCSYILIDGKVKKLTLKEKKNILSQNQNFAKDALRVLGFAYKIIDNGGLKIDDGDKNNFNNSLLEEGLIFVGLQAMIDPPRIEVKDSISVCKTAGIKVVMITGDNVMTAKAIANQLGIDGLAIDGVELDKMDDKKLKEIIDNVGVFARVSPAHKQKIIKFLKENGNVVAMTGDGVNDAPALKYSDIGLSMGITGTDVTKEASDMILLDDNFSTIVNAIYEGRGIYDNIKKFVNYLLSTNFAEILIIFISVLLGLPLPLIAIQILWINLVTDGLPALALGVDPASPGIMSRKPRKLGTKIIDKNMKYNIIVLSFIMTLGALFLFYRHYEENLVQARTGVFVFLTLLEMLRIWMIRNDYDIPLLSNKWLIGAVFLSVGLVILVVYVPFLAVIFKTQALSLTIWLEMLVMLVALILLVLVFDRFKNLQKFKK